MLCFRPSKNFNITLMQIYENKPKHLPNIKSSLLFLLNQMELRMYAIRPKLCLIKLNKIQLKAKKQTIRGNLAKKNFIGVRSIEIRSVNKSDATVDGMVDQSDHFRFRFWRAIEGRHAHATEALSWHFQPL